MPDIGYPITVEVDAQGNIIPQGIDLQAGVNSTPPTHDRIRWISQADGSVVAELYAYSTGSGASLDNILTVKSEAATGTAETAIQAVAGTLLTELDLTSLAGTSAQAILHCDATTYLIGDNTGRSNFAQIPAAAKKVYADFHISGLTWPGASNTTSYAFAHGLPAPTTARYLVTYADNGLVGAFCSVQNATASGCTIASDSPGGAPGGGTLYDLMILAILDY